MALIARTESRRCVSTSAAACIAALLVAACIPIPYKPSATVTPDTPMDVSATLSVSNRRDDAAKGVAKYLQDRNHQITVVANHELAAIAFPEGSIALETFMEPALRARLQRELGLSYVVLVGDMTSRETSRHGGFIPLLGLGTATDLANVVATVIDMSDGKAVTGLNSTAQGRMSGAIYGFYGLFIVPMTDKGAYDGIARGVADAIAERAGIEKVKVAVVHVGGLGPTEVTDANNSCPEGVECLHAMTAPASASATDQVGAGAPPR